MFCLCSKPRSLHICKHLLGNVQNHSPKNVETSISLKTDLFGTDFRKLDLKKSTSYGTSGRSAKGKMTVHWSSFYQVFIKNNFYREKSTFLKGFLGQTHILMEKHFFIWSHLRCVCKRLCLNGANGPRPRAQMNGPKWARGRAQMNGPKWVRAGPKWMGPGPTGPKWIP